MHGLRKEFPGEEFEVKFAVNGALGSPVAYLRRVESALRRHRRYRVIPVREAISWPTHFFTDGRREYALYETGDWLNARHPTLSIVGGLVLKIKLHRTRKRQYVIYRNRESFLTKPAEIFAVLQRTRLRYVGDMVKHRAKDFVIDRVDGRVYSVAVTVCTSGSRVQRQLEVEYSGYLPGKPQIPRGHSRNVIAGVLALSAELHHRLPTLLSPTEERKLTFVTRTPRHH